MRSLVIYHTCYGNTKLVAEAICNTLGEGCSIVSAKGFDIGLLENVGLVIIGSPVIAWNPSDKILDVLTLIRSVDLKGKGAASFDTRINMRLSGDASKKISKILKRAGARIVAPPRGFYVKGKQGPLLEGELDSSVEWAKQILKNIKH